jgi:hypothetical protein
MPNPNTFEEISNMNIDDIEDNVLTPKGSYIVLVKGQPEQGTSSQKQTPFWRYKFTPVEALPDVDRDQLGECGGLNAIEMEHSFYMVDKALPMFRNFLKDALGMSGMTVAQAVAESTGKQCKVHVTHRPTQRRDGTVGLRAEIDSFAAV